jgi:sugar phosphate isomerase/epimerase
MSPCPFGINGGEFPEWPVERIVELAVKVGAQFVELPAGRLGGADAAHAREVASAAGLATHVNGLVSALPAAFASARALQAPYLVVGDDAIERTDASRAESFAMFRAAVLALLEAPAHRIMRLALENSIIKVTRRPEDLGELVAEVGHPRFGVNFDADNFYNAGIEPFPYAYELLKDHILHVHAKDSARYNPAVHGSGKRVLHRAGGNVVCVPLGLGAVNWAGLIARLLADGYRGPVSLEPHALPHEMAPGMEADAAYLRRAGLIQ